MRWPRLLHRPSIRSDWFPKLRLLHSTHSQKNGGGEKERKGEEKETRREDEKIKGRRHGEKGREHEPLREDEGRYEERREEGMKMYGRL